MNERTPGSLPFNQFVVDETVANARLIAASKDLLAACKAAQGVCDTMGVGMVAFRVNEVGDLLRAAIAKAES